MIFSGCSIGFVLCLGLPMSKYFNASAVLSIAEFPAITSRLLGSTVSLGKCFITNLQVLNICSLAVFLPSIPLGYGFKYSCIMSFPNLRSVFALTVG